MQKIMSVLLVAISMTGCSKSSIDLLKSGDPQVCTKEDVTDQVFEIVRQNASAPANNGLLQDYETLKAEWVKKVALTIDAITSRDVDAANQKITCTGLVRMKANDVDREQDTIVDYQIVVNLSEGKPIVSVDTSQSRPALERLLSAIAAPLFQEANQKIADQTEADRNKWLEDHSGALQAKKAKVSTQYVPGTFTEDELDAIAKVEVVKEECLKRMDAGDYGGLICSFREALINEMHNGDLCNPDGSSWTRCNTPVALAANAPGEPYSTPRQAIAPVEKLDDSNTESRGELTQKERARAFAQQFFEVTEKSANIALPWLSTHYGGQINYFGKRLDRNTILADKASYINRWSERTYLIEPNSMAVTCGGNAKLCRVTGILDYTASSAKRGASTEGKAAFDLVAYMGSREPVIVGENSRVIDRH